VNAEREARLKRIEAVYPAAAAEARQAGMAERLKTQNSIKLWKDCERHRWVATNRPNVERCARCPVLRIVPGKIRETRHHDG
jgi:hypothetical protein